jgi:ABC-type phosphate transport system auxiliary subunit
VNTNSGKNILDRWMKAISLSLIGLVLLLALLAMKLLGYFADDTITFNTVLTHNK